VLAVAVRETVAGLTIQAMTERDFISPEAQALLTGASAPMPMQQSGERVAQVPLLYLQIALNLAQMVAGGTLQPGQRLPSVRDLAAQNNVSVATVVQALATLEEHRLVQPRARSGYFVSTASRAKAAALVRKIRREPETPKAQHGARGALAAHMPLASFAGYAPKDKDFFDTDRVRVALSRATRLRRDTLAEYISSVGTLALRTAVALRGLHLGCALKAEDIVITSGCINAVALCLQAVTKPGDMVAIESPTFFGFLDLLESLNLKAIALPTDPRTGVSLPALQLALDTQPIKALLLVPTLSNPLASIMPLTHKRALARMVAQYRVPLIEDVVFNDLLATDARRRAVKAYDSEGWVMTCGSFAKTVAPGIRLGWVDAGRWSKQVGTLKRVQGAATNAVLEHALADLLTQGSYESHLRRLCLLMKQRLGQARKIIQSSFPANTKVNDPPVGYTLWVELPAEVDSMVLFQACRSQGIVVGPGQLFCASHRYRHCLRLSFSGLWGPLEQAALAEVGRLAHQLVDSARVTTDSNVIDITRMDFMCRDEVSAYDLW
jgi:DNA-binding transcriptional MocR family regulator